MISIHFRKLVVLMTTLLIMIGSQWTPVHAAGILHAWCNGLSHTLVISTTGTFNVTIFVNGAPYPAAGAIWSGSNGIILSGDPIFSTGAVVSVIDLSGSPTIRAVCSNGSSLLNFTDGRLNQEPYQTATIYCKDGTLRVYAIYQGVGYLAINMTRSELATYPAKPHQNYLIRQNLGVRLYRLSSGWLQVNRAMDDPGKDYSFLWPGCM